MLQAYQKLLLFMFVLFNKTMRSFSCFQNIENIWYHWSREFGRIIACGWQLTEQYVPNVLFQWINPDFAVKINFAARIFTTFIQSHWHGSNALNQIMSQPSGQIIDCIDKKWMSLFRIEAEYIQKLILSTINVIKFEVSCAICFFFHRFSINIMIYIQLESILIAWNECEANKI